MLIFKYLYSKRKSWFNCKLFLKKLNQKRKEKTGKYKCLNSGYFLFYLWEK